MNPIEYPELLEIPDHLSGCTDWHGHMPFAFYAMARHKPKLFVELGVYRGDSYFTFCQGAKNLYPHPKCIGIDTFGSDPRVADVMQYGVSPETYEHIVEKNIPYRLFSIIHKARFQDVLPSVEDGSIDLLHIDGDHAYHSVRRDFETWKPKLSNRGIVLFHDIALEQPGQMGAREFWSEIIESYPYFEFYHSYGLGILGVGKDSLSFIEDLHSPDPQEVRSFFEAAANHIMVFDVARDKLAHVD